MHAFISLYVCIMHTPFVLCNMYLLCFNKMLLGKKEEKRSLARLSTLS